MWQRQVARQGAKFIRHVVPAVAKPIHSLWNQVIGFFFLCFAGIFAIRTISYYRSYLQSPPDLAFGDLMRVVVTAFFGLVMGAFGVASLMKARRISRS